MEVLIGFGWCLFVAGWGGCDWLVLGWVFGWGVWRSVGGHGPLVGVLRHLVWVKGEWCGGAEVLIGFGWCLFVGGCDWLELRWVFGWGVWIGWVCWGVCVVDRGRLVGYGWGLGVGG